MNIFITVINVFRSFYTKKRFNNSLIRNKSFEDIIKMNIDFYSNNF